MANKKLSDKQIKKLIAERAEGKSYNALSKKYNISANTAKNYCINNQDFAQICAQKKEQNTQDVLAFMESRKNKACALLDAFLDGMADESKIAEATIVQLSTAFGTVVDKFAKNTNSSDYGQQENHNALIEAIKKRNED